MLHSEVLVFLVPLGFCVIGQLILLRMLYRHYQLGGFAKGWWRE